MTKINLISSPTEFKCPDGIISEYLKFTEGHESPDDFHLWTVIGAIAMVLGRSVFYEKGVHRLYPNLYIVLVGESALTHKSTAMSLLLDPLKDNLKTLDFLSQKITPQAMIHRMNKIYVKRKVSEIVIHASEMSVLLGRSNIDDTLLKILTDFWDCPKDASYETIGRGLEIVNNVCVNMLAGTTAQWLRNSVPADSLGGGFFSRIVFVHRPSTGRKVPFMDELFDADRMIHLANVINDLKLIHAKLSGPMFWTNDARERFRKWYLYENKIERADEHLRGYLGRKGEMIIKLAIIHSASRELTSHIKLRDIQFGINILNENESHMSSLARELGQTDVGRKLMEVLDKIRNGNLPDGKTGITRTQLMNRVKHMMKAPELDDILYTLQQANNIEKIIDGRKTIYYYVGGKAND